MPNKLTEALTQARDSARFTVEDLVAANKEADFQDSTLLLDLVTEARELADKINRARSDILTNNRGEVVIRATFLARYLLADGSRGTLRVLAPSTCGAVLIVLDALQDNVRRLSVRPIK